MAELEIRVLGRPRVLLGGDALPLRGRPLTLAVRLAVSRSPATAAHLRRDLWPDGTGSDGALRVLLSRTRTMLGSEHLVRRDDGYVLGSGVHVDSHRFEALVAVGRDRERDLGQRIGALDEALDLWTGPAFDSVDDITWLRSEADRLNELSDQAVDLRFEARMLVDDPDRLVVDLRRAVGDAPSRERRTELLAIALYRADRQVEALRTIDHLRINLRDLGLSPGPSLSATEVRILHHDQTLCRSEDSSTAAPATPTSKPDFARRSH